MKTPWRGQGDLVEVSVWEMMCPGCEMEVEGAIGKVKGVASVEADHETDLVRIHLTTGTRRDEAIPRIRDAIHSVEKSVVGEDEIH